MTSLKEIGKFIIAGSLLLSCTTAENTLDTTLGHIRIQVEIATEISPDESIALTITSADGKYSHTWDNYKQFSTLEGYYAGTYHAKAVYGQEGAQGFDCPCYIGLEDFDVADNRLTDVNIMCQLSQAMVRINGTLAFSSAFPESYVQTHTEGCAYVDIPIQANAPAYIMPGNTEFSIVLASSENNIISLASGLVIPTTPDKLYTLNIDYIDNELIIEYGGEKKKLELTDEIISSDSPSISCKGFIDGETIRLTEGFPSESSLIMEVKTPTELRTLQLTTICDNPNIKTWPRECDLLSNSEQLTDKGLRIDCTDEGTMNIDFTHLLENQSVNENSNITFLLQATDTFGRESNVAVLDASIHSVEIIGLQITPSIVGIDVGTLTLTLNRNNVEANDFSLYVDDGHSTNPLPIKILSAICDNFTDRMVLSFELPEGITSVPIRVDFMGKTKLYTTVERQVPQYSLKIDPFATTLLVNIIGDSQAITSAITRYAHISANGKEIAILDRNIEEGTLYCAGLNPATNYTIESIVIADQYVAKTNIHTEKAQQLPDGDLEDVYQIIDYKNFPCGGQYSSTTFAIYNRQNFTDISVFWPKKGWASVNAKTFSTKAKNHNSWYMQPSAKVDFENKASGNKSISLSSVGWSHSGSDIPPYIQKPNEFVPYNPNTPKIDHISAGYLYLGDYRFNADNATETYTQGISFGSRPSSLNGYYKYIPDLNTPSDCGWVKVEVINVGVSGEETILATARMEFPNAPDFRSFNLPLNYDVLFLPATRVRVMFCTSTHTDGLSFDDPDVPVSVDIQNSRFIGSTLWVDNLSFSY